MKTRTFFHLVLLAYGLLLGCASHVSASAHGIGENEAVSDNSTRFPAGTVFVARQQQDGTLLWATKQTLHNARTGAEFAFPNPDFACKRITWSADQKRLLVQGAEANAYGDSFITDAYILEATSLRLVRHLKTPVAWWQGAHYAWIDEEAEPPRIVSSTGQRLRVPHNLTICAADPQAGYLLGASLLPVKQQWYPYMFGLWKQTPRGRLHRLRTLGKTYFDPGSSGVPSLFGMAGRRRVLVGRPVGGAFEVPQLAEGGRITQAFPGINEDYLVSERGPYAAGNTLFGLVHQLGHSDQSGKKEFLYQVTNKKITLKQIGADVVFVYYDPLRHAIGLGATTAFGVSVRFVPMR